MQDFISFYFRAAWFDALNVFVLRTLLRDAKAPYIFIGFLNPTGMSKGPGEVYTHGYVKAIP